MGYWAPYKIELSRQKFVQYSNITGSILAGKTQTDRFTGKGLCYYIGIGDDTADLIHTVDFDGTKLFAGLNTGVGTYSARGWQPAGTILAVDEYNVGGIVLMSYNFTWGMYFENYMEVVVTNGTGAAVALTLVYWLEGDNLVHTQTIV